MWPKEFEVLRLSLLEILGSLAMRVDHIGSTSVPGLGAKDIIDIQVTVRALTEEVKQRLVDAGYYWFEAFTHDHVPLGEDDDPKLWAKFTFGQAQGQRRANVHIRINGNPNQRYARRATMPRPLSRYIPRFPKRRCVLPGSPLEMIRLNRSTGSRPPFCSIFPNVR
jgi:GrpB-like predicted nucleotidyltransferase (UPF0157 family)